MTRVICYLNVACVCSGLSYTEYIVCFNPDNQIHHVCPLLVWRGFRHLQSICLHCTQEKKKKVILIRLRGMLFHHEHAQGNQRRHF